MSTLGPTRPAAGAAEPPLTRPTPAAAPRPVRNRVWPHPDTLASPVQSMEGFGRLAERPPAVAAWPSDPARPFRPRTGQEFDDAAAVPSALFTPLPDTAIVAPPAAPNAGRTAAGRADGGRADGARAGEISASYDWSTAPGPMPVEPVAKPRARDPSPSRLAYRMNRLWLTPLVRRFVRLGLPALLVALVAGGWLADAGRRAQLVEGIGALRSTLENLPQFQVVAIDVQSRSPEVAQGVAQMLSIQFPVSSFHLDLAELRRQAEMLDAVEHAWLQIRAGGVLEIRLEEREPEMVWRHAGGLDLVDATGHRVARLAMRGARADLPLIAGEGAPEAMAEARLLWAAATPLQARLRGLVRVGARRWDLMLDRNQVVQLPAEGALGALERVLALDAAQGLLGRDVAVVDLRNPTRPTLRLTAEAMAELNRIRRQTSGARNG